MVRYVKKSTGIKINDEGYIIEDDSMKPAHEHGTAIALSIRHICESIELTSINILNETLSADGRVLICAFQQALLDNPDIIHLSLGTTKWMYKFPLKKIVKEASQIGSIVVSAANNYGIRSYPSCIKGVVGVKGCKMHDYMKVGYKDGFFYAQFDVKKIRGIDELASGSYVSGNSMAAGYITGHIASLKYSNNTHNNAEIIELLKSLAQRMEE